MKKILTLVIISLLCLSMFSMLSPKTKASGDLVGYWSFDEDSGNIAHDSSGNGNDGTVYGASWTNGISNSALQFDGVDDHVAISSSPSLEIRNLISLETWIRPAITLNASSVSWICILDKANSYGFEMFSDASDARISFFVDIGGAQWLPSTTGSWTAGTWYHIAGTYDGTTERIYVNGVLENSQPFSGNIFNFDGPLSIGSHCYGAICFFNGTIDEVKIYNYARTAEEILFDYGLSGPVHIRTNGSIDPPTAPILTLDNVTYTLTGDIVSAGAGIVIERDNIILDGASHTLKGVGNASGIEMSYRINVTVKDTIIKSFLYGIGLWYSFNNTIIRNEIINNTNGIRIKHYSEGNKIIGNKIENNSYGIWTWLSENNRIWHNNFVSNSQQAYVVDSGYPNAWDDGYPFGGNYWSDYTSEDMYYGQYQNVTGRDGIGDTPYSIDAYDNVDRYPLMAPLDISAPYIPVSDPSIKKLPFRLSLIPLSGEWTAGGSYEATLSVAGDLFGIFVNLVAPWPADIALKTFDFVLFDKNGDHKLDANDNLTEQFKDNLEGDLRNTIFDYAKEFWQSVSLSVAQEVGTELISEVAGLVPWAFLSGVVALAARSFIVGLPLVIMPCMLSGFGYQDNSLAWTICGASTMAQNEAMGIYVYCPVDLTINDQYGRVINGTVNVIPGANYINRDLDGDGSIDHFISLPEGNMNYTLTTRPEEGANPNDTYTLIIENNGIGCVLAENCTIQNMRQEPYALIAYPHLTVPNVAVANLTSSHRIVFKGEMGRMNITVKNEGNYTEKFNVTAYANTTAIANQTLTIASGNSTIITFTWNTAGFAYGNYSISAYAWPIPGETNTNDNNCTGGLMQITKVGDLGIPSTNPPSTSLECSMEKSQVRIQRCIYNAFGVPLHLDICISETSGVLQVVHLFINSSNVTE